MTQSSPGTGTVIVVSIVTSLIVSALTVVGLQRFGGDVLAVGPRDAPKTAMVPDLLGMKAEAADELLTARGLRLVVGEKRADSSEATTVLEQAPLPQSRVDLGAQVSVVVSAGRPQPTVPQLAGLSLEDAKAALTSAGLALGEVQAADSDQPPDTVIGATPPTGTVVAPESVVALTVARAAVEVPKLLGMNVRKARERIEKAGLTVGSVKERYDRRRKGYIVLDQDPKAGAALAKGSPVQLVINQGD